MQVPNGRILQTSNTTRGGKAETAHQLMRRKTLRSLAFALKVSVAYGDQQAVPGIGLVDRRLP